MKQQKRAKQLLKRFKQDAPSLTVRIGDHANNINVPNREGYIYVRYPNGNVGEVYNDSISPTLDSEIVVGHIPGESHLLKVIGQTSGTGRYGDSSTRKQNVIKHNKAHQWMSEDGGNDVLFSELRQFLPFRPTPEGGMSLHIYRGISWRDGEWKSTSGSSIDFEPYVPSVSGTAHYALVYINTGSFPDFIIGSGNATEYTNLDLTDIPDPYPGTLPIAAVRLYEGMTGIAENRRQTDIIDLRFPFWHDHPFTDLDDVPHSYTGSAGKTLFVKQDESGLEFLPFSSGSYTLDESNLVDVYAMHWMNL